MRTLIGNTMVGLVLLFLTNLFLADDLPINITTVIICAILGVLGWALILILHLLGIAFQSTEAAAAYCGSGSFGPRAF